MAINDLNGGRQHIPLRRAQVAPIECAPPTPVVRPDPAPVYSYTGINKEIEDLPVNQQMFVRCLLADPFFNATKAAQAAGFKHPSVVASNLLGLPHISRIVGAAIASRSEQLQINSQMVLKGLYQIATADLADAHLPNGELKNIHDIPVHLRHAIDGVDVFESIIKGQPGTMRKVRLSDRLKAWELLGKHLAMFTDKFQTRIIRSIDDLTEDEQEAVLRSLEAKLGRIRPPQHQLVDLTIEASFEEVSGGQCG